MPSSVSASGTSSFAGTADGATSGSPKVFSRFVFLPGVMELDRRHAAGGVDDLRYPREALDVPILEDTELLPREPAFRGDHGRLDDHHARSRGIPVVLEDGRRDCPVLGCLPDDHGRHHDAVRDLERGELKRRSKTFAGHVPFLHHGM